MAAAAPWLSSFIDREKARWLRQGEVLVGEGAPGRSKGTLRGMSSAMTVGAQKQSGWRHTKGCHTKGGATGARAQTMTGTEEEATTLVQR